MARTTVYRVGSLDLAIHEGEVRDHFALIDSVKPAHHPVGRSNCLYASADLAGFQRWVNALMMCSRWEKTTHEITVDDADVMVYSIEEYDRIPTHTGWRNETREERAEKFWASGMTLAEWNALPEWRRIGEEVEVLVDPAKIVSVKTLSSGMLVSRMKKANMEEMQVKDLRRMLRNYDRSSTPALAAA